MKICLYTMYFPPDFGSAPILMQELAMFLAQHGHQVSVITTIPRQRGGFTFSGKLWHTEESDGSERFASGRMTRPIRWGACSRGSSIRSSRRG